MKYFRVPSIDKFQMGIHSGLLDQKCFNWKNKQTKQIKMNKQKQRRICVFFACMGSTTNVTLLAQEYFSFYKGNDKIWWGKFNVIYIYTWQFFCWILKKCKQATAEVAFLHRLRASLCFSLCNSSFATPINLLIWSAKNTVKVPFGYDDTHHSLFLCCCLEENAIILFFLTRLRLPGAEP